MPEQRRKFSPQFRAEAVQLVIETGKPVAEVARDLGVVSQTLVKSLDVVYRLIFELILARRVVVRVRW
jgi:hypothetical protein